MAKKNSGRTPFQGVVQIPLLPDHEPKLIAYMADGEKMMADAEKLVRAGYTIAFRPDNLGSGVGCSIMGGEDAVHNSGYMLFGNAESLWESMGVALFKHFFICAAGEWSAHSVETKSKYR